MGVPDSSNRQLFGRTAEVDRSPAATVRQRPPTVSALSTADLRLANLLIDGEAVKVIDFDDCGFGWHMYDAATPVSFYEHEPQVPRLLEAWLKGYRAGDFPPR